MNIGKTKKVHEGVPKPMPAREVTSKPSKAPIVKPAREPVPVRRKQ